MRIFDIEDDDVISNLSVECNLDATLEETPNLANFNKDFFNRSDCSDDIDELLAVIRTPRNAYDNCSDKAISDTINNRLFANTPVESCNELEVGKRTRRSTSIIREPASKSEERFPKREGALKPRTKHNKGLFGKRRKRGKNNNSKNKKEQTINSRCSTPNTLRRNRTDIHLLTNETIHNSPLIMETKRQRKPPSIFTQGLYIFY